MMKKHKRRTALAVLLLVMTIISALTVSVSAVEDFAPRGEPIDIDGYRVFQMGLTGNYYASINKHIEYHGDDALLWLKVWRTDENIKDFTYDVCLTGWKCTTYTADFDEILVPLNEAVNELGWSSNALDNPWTFIPKDNVERYAMRVYVPNSLDTSLTDNPFLTFLGDVPQAVKNGFDGFFFRPNGMITKTAQTATSYLLLAVALSVFVTIFKHILENLNVFRRKK